MGVEARSLTDWLTPDQIGPLLEPPKGGDAVRRWIRKGIKTRAGYIRLAAKWDFGFAYTSLQLVEEFKRAIRAAREADYTPVSETPTAAAAHARKEQQRAAAKLNRKRAS